MGLGARILMEEGDAERARVTALRDRLLDTLRREVEDLRIHGSLEHRVGSNINVAFGDIQGDTFLSAVPDLAVSGGAACASGKAEASHVLLAMGLSQTEANRALRIAIGRMTTEEEVTFAAQELVQAARRLSRSRRR